MSLVQQNYQPTLLKASSVISSIAEVGHYVDVAHEIITRAEALGAYSASAYTSDASQQQIILKSLGVSDVTELPNFSGKNINKLNIFKCISRRNNLPLAAFTSGDFIDGIKYEFLNLTPASPIGELTSRAGRAGLYGALAFSGIENLYDVHTGNKTIPQAIIDIVIDGFSGFAAGYAGAWVGAQVGIVAGEMFVGYGIGAGMVCGILATIAIGAMFDVAKEKIYNVTLSVQERQ